MALFEVIGHFEVSLRNTIDTALAERHEFKGRRGDWLDNAQGELTERAAEALNDARLDAVANRRRGRGTHESGRGHIIAELNFSFWRRLLDRRYENVHGSAVMRLFPELRKHATTNADMAPLRALVEPAYRLRNRIAHHEPIWNLNWRQSHAGMLMILRQASPELSTWVTAKCKVPGVLAGDGA